MQNVLVTSRNYLSHILPFLEKFMAVVVLFSEFLCGFVEFYLGGLGGGDLFFEILLFPSDLNGKFFDL